MGRLFYLENSGRDDIYLSFEWLFILCHKIMRACIDSDICTVCVYNLLNADIYEYASVKPAGSMQEVFPNPRLPQPTL
jgi:hypothetical protein